MNRAFGLRVAAAVLLCAGSACKKSAGDHDSPRSQMGVKNPAQAAPEHPGILLAKGPAADLRVTADGRFATFLLETRKPPLEGIPVQMLVGEAWVASTSGGKPRKLGEAVANTPGAVVLTSDSRYVLYLTGYDPSKQQGALSLLALENLHGESVSLGASVTYVMTSADGRHLAFVDGGTLKLGVLPGGPFKDISTDVSTAQFSPDGRTLFYKRTLSAAGALHAMPADSSGPAKKLGEQVGDVSVSPDSKHVAFQVRSQKVPGTFDLQVADLPALEARTVSQGTANFAFSPDSRYLARNQGGRPEKIGDLVVGPAESALSVTLAERVQDFAFSPDSRAIAYLDKYDLTARAGLVGVAQLGDPAGVGKVGSTGALKPVAKRIGERSPNFAWGADSRYVAFLSRFLKPMYSVDLMLYTLGDEKAVKAQPGVFGYSFTEHNEALLYRGGCVRNGRECDLKALPLPRTDADPETWAKGIFTYRPSENGERYLLSYARMDAASHDLSVYDVKSRTEQRVDHNVTLPAQFAAKDGSKIVYVITRGDKAGVYASTLKF